ncbi:hypothetical protein AK88_01620 [Plasmodium fragile]|uniref:Uncharacterized protein n=1 Tax=Plasmodium fragile TaxID=5857 RepID=A0A0D9QNW6_PLAFR|nr:uncharacterized protein AK88_01620 [Plasmodium fragile]KJP88739.1 hypothetical protein AK88_01620 [Plasmodium fragile]
MCYLKRSLSKSVNSLVLHFEFVKCKNLASYRKKGKYYMIISYDNLLFYEKDFYEVQFQIFFADIRQIYICDESNYVHVTLKEGASINDIGIKGINKSILVKQLCVAYSTYYMFNLNMNIYMPITNETYEERCHRTGHHSQLRKVDLSVQPFIGYRKVVFDEYFFFIHKSFQNFASVSSESTFYIDHRGIEISIKIDDQKSMIELDGVIKKSKKADSNFYQLASSHLNSLINDSKIPLILRKNFYYKKMNLSDDLAKWSGYEVYLKNETHTIVCIILRRMFIPPLLDKSQDIFVTFKISHQSQQEFDVTDKDLHAEVYVVANSITPNDIHNTFYANLIQVQVDALLYNSEVYAYFESALKIKPSYFDHLKMFFKSMMVILKEGDVVINSDVMDFLGEDTKVERNLEYLLNVILNQIPGVNLLDTHKSEQIKINRVLHRLSDYLLYCLDSGFLSEKFNVTDLIKGAIAINADSMLAMNDVMNFLLHLRTRDYSVGYRKDCLELLREEEEEETAANGPNATAQSLATGSAARPTRAAPRTKIERLLESEDHSVSDFLLFHLHQCGYINQHCQYKHDTSYKQIIACILKYGVNIKIKKKILKKLLIFSNDYKNKYDSSLISAIMYFLANICEEKKRKKKKNLSVLILSILINITNNNDETKNVLINYGIHKTCNLLILLNDYNVVHKVVLLYINLSKSTWMCEGIINSGILLHMMDILFNTYSINLKAKKEICINILCVIGQVCNYCKTYAQFLLSNCVEIVAAAICIYQTTDMQQFKKVKLIYFFKKILIHSYEMNEQICLQLCPLIIKEMQSASEDRNFIYSSLSLFEALCCYKVNCLHMERMQIIPLLRFVKSLNVVELYKRAQRIEDTIRKNGQLR